MPGNLGASQISVEHACKPDSVHWGPLRAPSVTAITLGRLSPNGSMPPTRQLSGTTSILAYLVLLRAEIARFTRPGLPPADSSLLL